jgi:BirA family biotin operon repressor/biotin-[acetyl-CoA-carboxylase] ligase
MADLLTPQTVEPLLRGRFGRPYRWVERTESTQRLLGAEEPEGAVVATDEQTAGRGRLGRVWEAPPGTSILVSLVLRPPVRTADLPELSLVAGRAVAGALASVAGVEATLKFPNDVLVGGRKVAGILAEASGGRVVLGIGVNVNQTETELPAETVTPPTSLRAEVGVPLDRAPILAAILAHLETEYDAWIDGARG